MCSSSVCRLSVNNGNYSLWRVFGPLLQSEFCIFFAHIIFFLESDNYKKLKVWIKTFASMVTAMTRPCKIY